jgi:prephenate dehydrogenase
MDRSTTKIGVIGGSQGLGSWVTRYFNKQGYDTRFSSADPQSQFPDNPSLVQWADVVFLAVPIPAMQPVLTEIYPLLHGKVLVEVCSVKKFLIDAFQELAGQWPAVSCQFVSIHPMFSQMVRQIKGQVILFNYQVGAENGAYPWLWELFVHDKAQVYELDYLQHDRIMGVVQGLNHFNVFASAATLAEIGPALGKIKDFSSPPYRIFLIFFARYVLQDPRLYADIQMYNTYVPEVLAAFRQQVDTLYQLIVQKDREGFVEYATKAKGYFLENQEDTGISNHLIEQLGIYINSLKSNS